MATYQLNNFNFSFTVRRAPKSGPTSSDKWNDTVDELARDLTNIALEWNTKIVPLVAGVPNGADDTAVNAFANGLDGKNLWVDQDSSATSDDTRYYNSTKARPNTLKEQFDNVYSSMSSEIDTLQNSITSSSSGLSTDQKNAIGAHIFNSSSTSSSSSLDGKSENNRLNILQLANDLYGDEVALDNNGIANLTNSVKAMVDALLTLHNGNWSDDVTLSHVGVVAAAQTDVAVSVVYDDTFVGVPITLEGDLNRIRNELKEAKGTAAWQTANSVLYAAGPDSLEDLLASTAGTGTKTATNPWGYHHDNIDGLQAALDNIRDFTGQDDHTDATPTYSSNNYVANGTSLETAIGALDTALSTGITGVPEQLTALEAFTGQDNNTDSTPTYSSAVYAGQGESLENAIGQLDAALSTVSGLLGSTTFIGLSDTPASYTGYGTYYVQVNQAENGLTFSDDILSDSDESILSIEASGVRTLNGLPAVSVAATGCMLVGSGIYLQSTNGTRYILTIADDGSLTTTSMP